MIEVKRYYTDQEVYDNRKTVIDFLKDPSRKKNSYCLASAIDDEARCCLGHMCKALFPDHQINTSWFGEESFAPIELIKAVGLHSKIGEGKAGFSFLISTEDDIHYSLAEINDGTDATPQEIGAMLEKMIMGGDDTPWEKIKV